MDVLVRKAVRAVRDFNVRTLIAAGGVACNASLRERLELSRIPKAFQGMSIALITAGILALAFMGFSGLVK